MKVLRERQVFHPKVSAIPEYQEKVVRIKKDNPLHALLKKAERIVVQERHRETIYHVI